MKRLLVISLVLGAILISGCTQSGVQERPTTWIFKFKGNYSGNYISAINYYNNTNTYRSFGTYLIDSPYVTTLNNGFFAMIYPNSESMAKRIAIFNKSIPKEGNFSFGDSPEMNREDFYKYVIEEHPLTELFFCDIAEKDRILISSELANGEIDNRCTKIELGTFGKE